MIVTLFESVQKAYTRSDQVISADWPTIATFLTTFNQCSNKEDMQLFNLWQFNPMGEPGRRRIYEKGQPTENYETVEGTIRRCKSNAQLCYGLILDFDGETRISDTVESLAGLSFAYYSSFRHTEETHKYRVVIPFTSGVSPQKFKRKKEALSAVFTKVDHASFSESQSFYLHSGSDATLAKSGWVEGEFLDIDLFDDTIEPERTELPKQEFTGDRNHYKETMIESLATCSGLHYANESSKHGVLTLVALCKSADFTYAEYNSICHNMAAPNSSLQEESFRKNAWLGWAPFSGVTAKVREDFISSYGGTSKFGVKEVKKTAQELRDVVIRKWGNGKK